MNPLAIVIASKSARDHARSALPRAPQVGSARITRARRLNARSSAEVSG
jgi:hypothetical protein